VCFIEKSNIRRIETGDEKMAKTYKNSFIEKSNIRRIETAHLSISSSNSQQVLSKNPT